MSKCTESFLVKLQTYSTQCKKFSNKLNTQYLESLRLHKFFTFSSHIFCTFCCTVCVNMADNFYNFAEAVYSNMVN
jgi:hypothetical protein